MSMGFGELRKGNGFVDVWMGKTWSGQWGVGCPGISCAGDRAAADPAARDTAALRGRTEMRAAPVIASSFFKF